MTFSITFRYATILAFDVKVERDAQELADSTGVKIFQADIIYHLFDKFMAYREELKQRKRDEFKHIAVFPCKLRVLPQVTVSFTITRISQHGLTLLCIGVCYEVAEEILVFPLAVCFQFP